VSFALGPLGLIEALIVLGLIAVQVRRLPERTGAYLTGASLVPLVVLASVVSRLPACPGSAPIATGASCYSPITVPAMAAYAIAGVVGAILLGMALRRLFSARSS
jgi:hypothetical protein